MTEALARAMFKVWRDDQTADVWDQLSESEQGAWLRVARLILATPTSRIVR